MIPGAGRSIRLAPACFCLALLSLLLAGCTNESVQPSQPKPRTTDIGECQQVKAQPQRITCVARAARAIARHTNTADAVRKVEQASAASPALAAVCHQAMHQLAARLPVPSGQQIATASTLRGACASGYVHGLFERLLERNHPADDIRASKLCDQLRNRGDGDLLPARECYHGIGHGLHRRTGSITNALADCERLLASRDARIKCYGGAYMQDSFTARRFAMPAADEPGPCANTPAPDRELACFAFAVSFNGSLDEAIGWCDRATTEAARALCLASYGRVLPPDHGRQCADLPDGASYEACIAGFLRGNIHEARLLKADAAAAMCTDTPTPYDVLCRDQLRALYMPGTRRPRVSSMSPAVL